MSGATAALRIVKRQRVYVETEDDDPSEIMSRRDRNSWSPKVTNSAYDAMKPGFSNPIEAKSARLSVIKRPYSENLAKVFFAGAFLFVIGIIVIVVCLRFRDKEIEVAGWAIAAAGATISALSLVRAQDLIRRQK